MNWNGAKAFNPYYKEARFFLSVVKNLCNRRTVFIALYRKSLYISWVGFRLLRVEITNYSSCFNKTYPCPGFDIWELFTPGVSSKMTDETLNHSHITVKRFFVIISV